MAKHFIVSPGIERVDKDSIKKAQKTEQAVLLSSEEAAAKRSQLQLQEEDFLVHTEGRVVIKIDLEYKNFHTFSDGTTIRRERNFNEFNRNITQPVNAITISGEGIEKGAEILIHPNGVQDSNRIFDYKDHNKNVHYYSIHREHCFAWRTDQDWRPLAPYDFALRVFEPYKGSLTGMEPTKLKDVLWVTTGELAGNVVKTIVACDYQIVFQDINGREGNLIRFRPFGDVSTKREEEAIAILHEMTDKVNAGELLVGITISDAKKLSEYGK